MGLGTVFTDVVGKIKDGFAAFAGFVTSHLKIALLVAAAVLFIILLLLVLAISSRKPVTEEMRPAAAPVSEQPFVTQDFFLPYEPDFIPDVILEREPRDKWTEEDARPFWTDPMEGNEGVWRKRIETGIDAILEQVP
jgi:urea transporter